VAPLELHGRYWRTICEDVWNDRTFGPNGHHRDPVCELADLGADLPSTSRRARLRSGRLPADRSGGGRRNDFLLHLNQVGGNTIWCSRHSIGTIRTA
jgi:hypothetical protein